MGVDYRAGDYRVVADRLRPAAEQLVQAAGVAAGQLVVDVAAGSGNVAHLCAGLGATPVAVDLVHEQLLLARERGEGVQLVRGDAQALPLRDGVADAVLSTFGLIFAPRPADAVRAAARVCRPGGVLGLTAWPQAGWQGAQERLHDELVPALRAGHDHLAAWGTADAVRAHLAEVADDVEVVLGELVGRWASPQAWWEQRSATAPPVRSARRLLDDAGFAELARRTLELVEEHGAQEDGAFVLREPYLLAVARRR